MQSKTGWWLLHNHPSGNPTPSTARVYNSAVVPFGDGFAGVFRAGYFETDYSAFMSWRDFGHPGPVVRNGFAMAALQAAAEGAVAAALSAACSGTRWAARSLRACRSSPASRGRR